MGERHPMIVHYERIMENYDSDRVAAKLRDFLEEAQRIAKADYAAEMRAQAARRPWREHLLDALAFALMGLVALIDRRVWSKEREAGRTRFAVLQPGMDIRPEVVIGKGLVRWRVYTVYLHDGWKATRYV